MKAPTQISVAARQRKKSFEGGRMEDSLQRASRIRVFPRNATNDRIMLKAAKNIKNCFTSLTRASSREQYMLAAVFCISSAVSFSILIFL